MEENEAMWREKSTYHFECVKSHQNQPRDFQPWVEIERNSEDDEETG